MTTCKAARLAQKFYPAQQIRLHEGQAAVASGCDLTTLMERAGKALFDALQQHFPQTKDLLVLCGSGNNGGDGFVVARLAKQAGLNVTLYCNAELQKASSDTQLARQKWLDIEGEIQANLPTTFNSFDLIIDALLGTGIKQAVREPYQTIIAQINQAQRPVISIDIPSGINADTGQVYGQAIQATLTVTFVALKAGLLTGIGKQYCGKLLLDDLGIANQFEQIATSNGTFYQLEHIPPLPKRQINSYKGHFGRLLCIGGYRTMPGAIRLSANAALRCGAGLVNVLCHPESRVLVHNNLPELILEDDSTTLQPLLEWADSIIIGPGLSQQQWGKSLFKQVVDYQGKHCKPLVIDADGLTLLAQAPLTLGHHCILTPHPGEAARLLNCSVNEIETDRLASAQKIAQKYQCQVNLKGAGSVIITDTQLAICQDGNPGMASAGMGDTLTGIIGALLAQGLNSADALLHASALHARAGDLAAQKDGEHGMLASDLILFLRQLVNR